MVIDRAGARGTLLLSLLLFAASGTVPAFSDGVLTLLITRTLLGVATGLIVVSNMALIGAMFEGNARTRFLGYYSAVIGLGGIAMALAAGAIVDWVGWRAVFTLYLVGLVAAFAGLFSLPRFQAEREAARPNLRQVFSRLWPLFSSSMLYWTASFMVFTRVPFVLQDEGVHSGLLISVAMGANAGAGIIASLAYGSLRAHLAARGCQSLLIALLGAGIGTIAFVAHPYAVILGSSAVGFANGIANVHFPAAALDQVPPSDHTRAAGLIYFGVSLGALANPYVFELLSTHQRSSDALPVVTLAAAAALIVQLIASRRPQPRLTGSR